MWGCNTYMYGVAKAKWCAWLQHKQQTNIEPRPGVGSGLGNHHHLVATANVKLSGCLRQNDCCEVGWLTGHQGFHSCEIETSLRLPNTAQHVNKQQVLLTSLLLSVGVSRPNVVWISEICSAKTLNILVLLKKLHFQIRLVVN